jgi:hypothetical protein
MGKTAARKIRKTAAASVIPNRTIATGIQASGEIGRRNWITGSRIRVASGEKPSSRPSGKPLRGRAGSRSATRRSESRT